MSQMVHQSSTTLQEYKVIISGMLCCAAARQEAMTAMGTPLGSAAAAYGPLAVLRAPIQPLPLSTRMLSHADAFTRECIHAGRLQM